MATVFAWKRFWCPRGKPIDLSDNGFLSDPESEYGKYANANLVTFSELSKRTSLALLGEPGIGKSWALSAERANADSVVSQEGGKTLWLDLRSFGSEERLWKTLFEGQEITEWRKAEYILYLFLDSLDECLLRIDNVAALLADQLPKEPVSRLRLRIACRTAQWPSILENALKRIFGADAFEAYELAPLRRKDVLQAAEQSGINPSIFLDRVHSLDVTSFAIKPVTLKFLLNTYIRDGSLPTNQVELYEKGCRILCEESSESRQSSGQRGQLSPDQRLAVASRIAAITQFGNRYAIWTQSEAGPVPQEDALLANIVGGKERGSEETVVSADAIRETLNTGLFSSRGLGRIGWAHQTYAEFLAARYTSTHDMPAQQIRPLIFHPEGTHQRLIPQLHETAAWISVMNPTILHMVAKSDPEALLGAAAASLSNEQRKRVTQAILDQSEAGRPFHLRWEMFPLYRKLCHPELSLQLRPYLMNKNLRTATRDVAIDIARACQVKELASELADIALDLSENMQLRVPAGATAAELGSAEVRARLRPLALEEAGDDPDDELKGSGLAALWPDLITAKELFPLITRPKRSNLRGRYSSFLYDDLVRHLKVEDINTALEWLSKQGKHSLGPLDYLMDEIVELAWSKLEEPGTAKGLAAVVLSRIKLQDNLMSGFRKNLDAQIRADHRRRQLLLSEILPNMKDDDIFYLTHFGIPIVTEEDFPWILKRIAAGDSSASEAGLAYRMIDPGNPEQMRALYDGCQQNPTLNAKCKQLFEPVLLDSEVARFLREDLEHKTKKPEQPLGPLPEKSIEDDLREIDGGNLFQWVQLTLNLSLKPDSRSYEHIANGDLTDLPVWKAASEQTKERIISAAQRYVIDGEPDNDKWFGTSQTYWSAIGGFRALALLLRVKPDRLDTLDRRIWRKWVPILLRPPYIGNDKFKIRTQLLQMAESRVPDEVAERLDQLLDQQMKGGEHFFLENEVDLCWSKQLEAALARKVRELKLKPSFLRGILSALLKHNPEEARILAKPFIPTRAPDSEPDRSMALAAIEALVTGTEDAGWSEFWPTIKSDTQFGRFVVESLSYRQGGMVSFLNKLSEEQLGELYTWMLKAYPPSEREHRVAGAMSSVDTAVMFRDQIIEHLKNRGTFAACQAIRRTMDALPEHSWLALQLEQAETLARAATWNPVSAKQLLALVADSSKRLVTNEQELIGAVVESLDRLQLKLHQELPASKDLWNEYQGKYWPKDENDLSDYVTRHLREDIRDRGIVSNREVQIHRGIGQGTGQFTDIHVDAVVPGQQPSTYSSVSIIVEVKGSWHPQIFENMRTQLRDRYLKELTFRSGIYLIGWFSCIKWDDSDRRKEQCPSLSLNAAREKFSQQATELSTDGYHLTSYILDCSLT